MEKNRSNQEELPFQVVERKVTAFTRINDYFFAKKVRRNVKRNRTPEMTAYIADLEERKKNGPRTLESLSRNPMSVESKVREHLLSGKSITSLECLRQYGSTELRHEIAKLRKHMEIKDSWTITPSGKRVKRYYC